MSGWHDHAGTHLVCSMATGLITTTVTNPVDVVKTLVFVSKCSIFELFVCELVARLTALDDKFPSTDDMMQCHFQL